MQTLQISLNVKTTFLKLLKLYIKKVFSHTASKNQNNQITGNVKRGNIKQKVGCSHIKEEAGFDDIMFIFLLYIGLCGDQLRSLFQLQKNSLQLCL